MTKYKAVWMFRFGCDTLRKVRFLLLPDSGLKGKSDSWPVHVTQCDVGIARSAACKENLHLHYNTATVLHSALWLTMSGNAGTRGWHCPGQARGNTSHRHFGAKMSTQIRRCNVQKLSNGPYASVNVARQLADCSAPGNQWTSGRH